jgi:hypothetical protein
MTDELVKRLRVFGEQGFPIACQSADALEAQAKRIVELDADGHYWCQLASKWQARAEKAETDLETQAKRIVELEEEATAQCDRRIEQYRRAEKAEADLAAAMHQLDETRRVEFDFVAAQVALARGEKPPTSSLPPHDGTEHGSATPAVDPHNGPGTPAPGPSEAKSGGCTTCEGTGMIVQLECPDCLGTGNRETKQILAMLDALIDQWKGISQ